MKRLVSFLFAALCTAAVCFGQEQGGEAGGDSLVMWRWVNFAILAAGLGYLVAKYLPGFFESRGSAIQKDISEAQKAKQDSDQRAAAIDKRVSGLGAEIEAFRVQSRAEMEREGERIRQETAVHIRKINDQAQIEIESAGKAARREVRLYAANLALDLAAQRIRARLDAGTEAGLIDNFIGDLKRQESKN
jgi:F0F1-type ATP synthase membrane subunit b/b'